MLRLIRIDADSAAIIRSLELDLTVDQCENRVVFSNSDVFARMKLGAALSNDDAAGTNDLTLKSLDAESIRIRIAAVSG